MNTKLLSITAGILVLGLGLSGCSPEPQAQNTPEPSVTPTETVEPTETPKETPTPSATTKKPAPKKTVTPEPPKEKAFSGQCYKMSVAFGMILPVLDDYSRQSDWVDEAQYGWGFFSNQIEPYGRNNSEVALMAEAASGFGDLATTLRRGNYEVEGLLRAVADNYFEIQQICELEEDSGDWW